MEDRSPPLLGVCGRFFPRSDILMAVICSLSSFLIHSTTGNRCLADLARISSRVGLSDDRASRQACSN